VSVFTKTTSPKLIIQSDEINHCVSHAQTYRIFKSVCLIVLGIIILMTFFLNLKIYYTINQLSNGLWLTNCSQDWKI
jgi:hypothetical protein